MSGSEGKTDPPAFRLNDPLTVLRGIGSERQTLLARLDLRTVGDLLWHRPRRHEDRRCFRPIAEAVLGAPVLVHGTVVATGLKGHRHRRTSMFQLLLDDGTGRLSCRWWNQPYLKEVYHVGMTLAVFGRLQSLEPRSMENPETEVIESGDDASVHLNRIVPIYSLTAGLSQRWLRGLIWRTLPLAVEQLADPRQAITAEEPLSLRQAVSLSHFPGEMSDVETARRRLALDEFLELQLSLQARRKRLEAQATGRPCRGDNRWIRPFLRALGFRLTDAQTRVLREIRQDLEGPCPMRRLLQGDVGAGKTVVAACAALMTLESGYQVALMAPTDILAQQHYDNFQRWFSPMGIGVELRTGSRRESPRPPEFSPGDRSPAEKAAVTAELPGATLSGERAMVFVGTHALLENDIEVPRLGLVIIDEQHKFGVLQRERLLRKGVYPHLLVMTATPIPRTLGLTLYGDLEVSVLDELPSGRGRVRTYIRSATRLDAVAEFLRQQLATGRQAYIVNPLVEPSERRPAKAVTRELAAWQQRLAPFRVAMLHGRLPPEEKSQALAGFRSGAIPVLLATSVVEVGLDVPNATLMVIENADQFGLAQLHQLRGRIRRGADEATCILLADPRTPEAKERLRVLEQTDDGFAIAEADLRLRGPGEFLGTQQSGLPRFRFGDLALDLDLIQEARRRVARHLAAFSL